MSEIEFRKEAINANQATLYGNVLLLQPNFYKYAIITLLIIIILSVIYVFNGRYIKSEKAIGYLVPVDGLIDIYPTKNGQIEEIFIKDGESVNVNDNLIRITNKNFTYFDKNSTQQRLIEQLEISKKNLTDGLLFTKEKISAEKKILKNEIIAQKESIELLEEIIANKSNIVKDFTKIFNNSKNLLEKKVISDKEFKIITNDFYNKNQDLYSAKIQLIELKNTIDKLNNKLMLSPIADELEIIQIKESINQIEQKIITYQSENDIVIKSPINGTVTNLTLNPGYVINPQRPTKLLSIIPENAKMQAEIFVPATSIALIDINQKVQVKYKSLPHEKYGIFKGKIKSIGYSIFAAEEISLRALPPGNYYKIIVELDKPKDLLISGKIIQLKPGMLLEADINVDSFTFMQKIFEPLYALKGTLS